MSGGGPTSVVVSEETAASLLVTWVSPNAHVLQYRVTYTPLNGPDTQDSIVSGLFTVNHFFLFVHNHCLSCMLLCKLIKDMFPLLIGISPWQ